MKLLALALALLALAFPASSGADEPFGQHVAQCAQMLPPPDPPPPSIVCSHHGEAHEFANFGEMVLHMLEHH